MYDKSTDFGKKTWFFQTPNYLRFFKLWRENWCNLDSAHKIMIVSIKLCSDVRNDEYIILRNFGDRTMSGFEVIEGDLLGSPPVAPSKKKARSE